MIKAVNFHAAEQKFQFIGSVSSGLTEAELCSWLHWERKILSPFPLF